MADVCSDPQVEAVAQAIFEARALREGRADPRSWPTWEQNPFVEDYLKEARAAIAALASDPQDDRLTKAAQAMLDQGVAHTRDCGLADIWEESGHCTCGADRVAQDLEDALASQGDEMNADTRLDLGRVREAITEARYNDWLNAQEHSYSCPTWAELKDGHFDRLGDRYPCTGSERILAGWYEDTDRWLAALEPHGDERAVEREACQKSSSGGHDVLLEAISEVERKQSRESPLSLRSGTFKDGWEAVIAALRGSQV